MRGTTYAISEIVWWMLVALAIGILIGWLLRRWFDGGTRLKDVQAELEAKNVRYAELSGELGESKLQVERLNRDLEARAGELSEAADRAAELEEGLTAVQADLDSATARAGELESSVASVTADKDAEITRLGSAVAGMAALESSVADRDERIAELESEAAGLKADLKATAAELVEVRIAHADCTVTAEATSGRIAGLETAVAERDERIADLEAKAAAIPAGSGPGGAGGAGLADLEGLAKIEEGGAGLSSLPLTAFGTAGADHTDDLKVINGIGPKMEELLNGFGIRAWDQLAALTPDEVARVDEALEEFPGRIERDQWVAQARDLILRFPDPGSRPDRKTFLNDSPD